MTSAASPTTTRGVLRLLAGERGAAGVATAAIIVPVILMFIAVSVQVGVWYIGRQAALTAAEEGARAMAGQLATQGDGCDTARSFIDRAAHNLLTVDSITCTRGEQATVVVRGHSMSMIPGIPVKVTQTAALPVEKVS